MLHLDEAVQTLEALVAPDLLLACARYRHQNFFEVLPIRIQWVTPLGQGPALVR
jgi:hypothetical protein